MTTQNALEFAGALYPNTASRDVAIVETYVWADGWNSEAEIEEYLGTHSDAEIAAEVRAQWDYDIPTSAVAAARTGIAELEEFAL